MGSILEIIAKLLGLTDFIVRRRTAKADQPGNKAAKERQKNAEATANGTAGDRAVDLLNRLPDDKGA